MTIRPVQDEDYDVIAQLRHNTILNVNSKDYPDHIIQAWVDKFDMAKFKAEQCKRWVMIGDNDIIGFCSHELSGELTRVYIHQDHLRRGIGSQLIAIAEASMKDLGLRKAFLESTITARAFYENHGYQVTEQAIHPSDGAIIYKMIKAL